MRDSEIRIGGEVFARIPGQVAEAFFATVSYRLEPQGWGTRFPAVMNELYGGRLSAGRVVVALRELETIENELRALPVEKVVWDFQDLRRRVDAGQAVNHAAENARDYFVSSRNVPLTVELRSALGFSATKKNGLRMRTVGSGPERLKGWLSALFGAAWLVVGYRYFPNWIVQPVGISSGHGVLIWPWGIFFLALGWVVAIKGTHVPLLAPKKRGHAELLIAGCAALVAVFGYFCYR